MWRLWIDTGGTFTDCLATDPDGALHRAKVLSSSSLRATVQLAEAPFLRVDLGLSDGPPLPAGFFDGALLRVLDGADGSIRIAASGPVGRLVELAPATDGQGRALGRIEAGDRVELRFDEEAPILAARWVTRSPSAASLPPLELRLATTRGTNALLERRGAKTAFLVTRGFGDLLRIGDQRRPDLFALHIVKPEPLYERVVEVPERLDADGQVVRPLDLDAIADDLESLASEGFEAAAVALLHSYVEPAHEQAVARALRDAGIEHVSASADLAPSIKILPRAETAVVDAYLSPVVGDYLRGVREALGSAPTGRRLRVMTSAGGLVAAETFRAKDSLLSGPAGGVVGAARIGAELQIEKLVAFDMGGTSTDVSRVDGDFDYRYELQVGDARVAAPALAIETVAAGGGSICSLDGRQLKVGPESAGASPGPACYGAGGPLTLTDVNLLLGRLDPARFGLPVDVAAAERARDAVLAELRALGSDLDADALLWGYLAIADQRMASAVRRISVRQGYDPRDYALVAFGGAGGQHACAVAEELGMETVVLPREAGLLSALGLGAAVVERFAQRQVLRPLRSEDSSASGDVPEALDEDDLAAILEQLATEALEALAAEGVGPNEATVRRRLAFLRFAGQDATLEIESLPDASNLYEDFLAAYEVRFGYRPEGRALEIESLRVVASSLPQDRSEPLDRSAPPASDGPSAPAAGRRRAGFDGAWVDAQIVDLADLVPGQDVHGPALVFDAHASLSLAAGWRAERSPSGSLVARRSGGTRAEEPA